MLEKISTGSLEQSANTRKLMLEAVPMYPNEQICKQYLPRVARTVPTATLSSAKSAWYGRLDEDHKMVRKLREIASGKREQQIQAGTERAGNELAQLRKLYETVLDRQQDLERTQHDLERSASACLAVLADLLLSADEDFHSPQIDALRDVYTKYHAFIAKPERLLDAAS